MNTPSTQPNIFAIHMPTLKPKIAKELCCLPMLFSSNRKLNQDSAKIEIEVVLNKRKQSPAGNFSYPSSAAAVVFGVHLSARAVFRLDRKSPAIRPCV